MNRVSNRQTARWAMPKGMALVSVLLVSVIMLGLAGAFFIAHRSDLALMTSGVNREQTKNACLSVAEFIQYKLQNDRTFGRAAFSRDNRNPRPESYPLGSDQPVMTVFFEGNGSSAAKNVIHGTMPDTGVEFDVVLLNNLDGTGALSVPGSTKTTPPRTVRAWVTSRRANTTQKIDFVLKRSPFTNSSITSGKNISVQLTNSQNGKWWLGARQPSGNSVRASGTITGPEVWSPTGRAVLFTPPPGMESQLNPPFGVIQGERLNMQVDGVPTTLKAGDQKLRESEDNIQGVLSPGGGGVMVPELSRDDLQGPARKVALPKSDLVFRTIMTANGPVNQLEGDGQTLATYDPSTSPLADRWFSFNNARRGPDVTFDLESRVMAVAENVELQSGSEFKLRSVNSTGGSDSTKQPTLFLGSNLKGSAIDAASIDIQGSVGGMGALKSSNGDLKIAAKSSLSTTPDFGIALHSQRDVVLTKPGTSVNDGLAVDWDAFSDGYKKGGSGSNISLDNWTNLNRNSRLSAAASFGSRKLAEPGDPHAFDAVWAGLTADFPANPRALAMRDEWLKPGIAPVTGEQPGWTPPEPQTDPPELSAPIVELTPGVPAGPGISVDKYVRLREYLRSVKSGAPDESWLGSTEKEIEAQRNSDVTSLVVNQLSTYQLAAGQVSKDVRGQVVLVWKKLGKYFDGDNPYLAAYNPDMVFRGLIYAGRDFVFDTERKGVYIEGALVAKGDVQIRNATGAQFVYNSDLLENLFATDEEDTSVPLERSYWAYY